MSATMPDVPKLSNQVCKQKQNKRPNNDGYAILTRSNDQNIINIAKFDIINILCI